jgi:hypothetical protein
MNTQVGHMGLAGMDTILLHGIQLPEAQCSLRSRSHRHYLVLLRHMRVPLYLICVQKQACCLPKQRLEPAVTHCFVRTYLSTTAWSRIILKVISKLIWCKVWVLFVRGSRFLRFCAHCTLRRYIMHE